MSHDSPFTICINKQKKLLLFYMENLWMLLSVEESRQCNHITAASADSDGCVKGWIKKSFLISIHYSFQKLFPSTDWKLIPSPLNKSLQVKCI